MAGQGKVGFMGCTARLMMLVAAGLLLLSYLSVLINPVHAWWVTIFGLLFIPLLCLNAFLLIWALARRSGAIWIPALAMLPALMIIGDYWQFRKETQPMDGVKVVSYNVGRFSVPTGKEGFPSTKACADSVVKFLKEQDADIICLQEFQYSSVKEAEAFLRKSFPDHHLTYLLGSSGGTCFGNVTLSRFPIKDKGKFDFESTSNSAIYSDIDIGGQEVRLYNCHFQSYSISLAHLVKSIMGSSSKEVLANTEDKMRKSILKRPEQVDMVMRDIEACTKQTIVAGDFNDTPLSYTYGRLKKGHKDTFVEAGVHSGATYHAFRPFLRIDYLLCPKSFEVHSHDICYKDYSDHFPIVAVLGCDGAKQSE